jgi:hypothetical protein
MPSSLVKFHGRAASSDGRRLFWDRAEVDGVPFRGAYAPMMTEEEFEQRAVRVADFHNDYFDTTEQAQNQAYVTTMDAIANGWFQLVHIERHINGTRVHYVEWIEYYLEDGTRTPAVSPHMMELSHAQANLAGHPQAGTGAPTNGQAGGH